MKAARHACSLFLLMICIAFLSACRSGGGASHSYRQYGYTPREARVNKLLAEKLQEEVPFLPGGMVSAKEAFALLRIGTKVPIFVDWEGLEIFGISNEEEVGLPGASTGSYAILSVCGQLSRGLQEGFVVGYELVDGVVVISLNQVLDRGLLRPYHFLPDSPMSASALNHFKRSTKVSYESKASAAAILKTIMDKTETEYVIDYEEIRSAGVDLERKYELVIGKAPVDLATHLLLRKVNRREINATKEIGYGVIGGRIFISSGTELDRLTKVFKDSLPPKPSAPVNEGNE